MKNNRLVKSILWMLLIGSLYQVLLMLPTHNLEQEARNLAIAQTSHLPTELQVPARQLYMQQYLDSVSQEVIFEIPFVKAYTYHELKEQQLKLGLDLKGGMQVVLGFEGSVNDSQIEETRYLLEQRVDRLGLGNSKISVDSNAGEIHVEVPDVQNPERVRELLLAGASLEFWHLYRVTDAGILEGLHRADQVLKEK